MTITSNIKTQQGVGNLKEAGRNFADAAESSVKDQGADIADKANQVGQRVGEVASQVSQRVGEVSEQVGQRFNEVTRNAMTTAEGYARTAAEKAGEFSGRVNDFSDEVEDQIRNRPLQSILIALATGTILGLLLRK